MRRTDLRDPVRRLGIAQAVLLTGFVALGLRAADLSLFDLRGARRGEAQHRTTLRLAPDRGVVFDRDRAELAMSVDAPSIYVTPGQVVDARAGARVLAPILDQPASRLRSRLERDSKFVFLARWVEPEVAARVEALDLPGIGIVYEPRRVYPYGPLAAELVGFVNIDGQGVRGIEQQENDWLRGQARSYVVERDARHRLLAVSGVRVGEATGGDVALTLDAAFQSAAESALEDALRATGARRGQVITMDPHSGEILALAQRPSFDPNRFRSVAYPETRSRAFTDAIEPGSTFKVFLAAAALDHGSTSADALVDCENGSFRVPGKTIHDSHPHALLDLPGVIRVSSNIGAVKLAFALGPEPLFETLQRFGFGQRTESGFPSESAGLLRPWSDWRPVDHAAVSFGQGVSVTPVQLAAAVSALANGGEWVRPRLVHARRRPDGSWRATSPDRVRRVVSADVAAEVVAMMEGVVQGEGTGRNARLRGLRVAGKTGTAQILDGETGTYATNRYHAWFVGIVPAEAPRLVIVAELEEPRIGVHTGGAAAAPLFARVAAAQLARLGIVTEPERKRPPRPDTPTSPAVTTARSEPDGGKAANEVIARFGERYFLPDFRGLTVAEVTQLVGGSGLDLEIRGNGRAVDQEPDPGTILVGAAPRVRVHFRDDEDPT